MRFAKSIFLAPFYRLGSPNSVESFHIVNLLFYFMILRRKKIIFINENERFEVIFSRDFLFREIHLIRDEQPGLTGIDFY